MSRAHLLYWLNFRASNFFFLFDMRRIPINNFNRGVFLLLVELGLVDSHGILKLINYYCRTPYITFSGHLKSRLAFEGV
jgi:hypothetical protein